MVIASGLLALVIGAAFAVLLSSVAELRTSERRARQSEEVLVVANRLERLVVGNPEQEARARRIAQAVTSLVGLADRVEALGGSIRLDSPAGQGNRLQIDLPIHGGDHPSS